MAYNAEIIADSVSEAGDRLTTFEVTFPRMVLAEFNTHRMLSRNSASSRAIPVEKQLLRVLDDPFVPVHWGVNQPGMQADMALTADEAVKAEEKWLLSRDYAVLGAVALIGGVERLQDESLKDRIGVVAGRLNYAAEPLPTPVHKQIANRLLEPFMWHTVIVTATDWSNYFALRANPQAQPEIQRIAYMMRDVYESNAPALLGPDQWHLPLVQPDERDLPIDALKKIATARCARVSYLTHDTGQRDAAKDIALHNALLGGGHMSPFEHLARPMTAEERQKYMVPIGEDSERPYCGNFQGWIQYRKEVPNEHDYGLVGQS
ncbi:MAG TPA: FAD-dependent thymidylate synthase [Candidatus Saccharimonadales bacterium]|nr:FAD-dependent thymidylate synthase [Candidatus Saccharimonadales bacterium]